MNGFSVLVSHKVFHFCKDHVKSLKKKKKKNEIINIFNIRN